MEMQSNYSRGTSAFRAVWEGQNGDKLRSVFDECSEFHNLDGKNDVTDLKGFRQRVAGLRAAHPGARLQVQNPFGAGSHIAFDWSLGDASPDGFCMLRLNGDRVVELWELNGALA